MNRTQKPGWRKLVALFVAPACAGSWAAGRVRSVEDRAEITDTMAGRVLVYGRDHSYGFEDGKRADREWVSVEAHVHAVDSGLHGDAARALWDGILRSIRLREAGARPSPQILTRVAHFSQRCLHSDNTECVPDEVMLDISRTVNRRPAKQRSVLWSGPCSIAKLVSTSP